MIEYLAQHLWQMWAVIAVVCLILELTAGDFFIICFSIGAFFAALAAICAAGLCRLYDDQSLLGASFCPALFA